jgi:putative ATP-dependent endonuclease of OLD family
MRVLRLDIESFRCIRKFVLFPHECRNILIGPANVGKSTVLAALDLLLSPEHAYLNETDFSRFDIHSLKRTPGTTVKIGAVMFLTDQEWRHFAELEELSDLDVSAWGEGAGTESTEALTADTAVLRVALFCQWDRPDPEDRVVTFFPKFAPPGDPDCRTVKKSQREALGFCLVPYDAPLWELASLSARSHLSRAARSAGWDPMAPGGIPAFVDGLVTNAEGLPEQPDWKDLRDLSDSIAEELQRLVPIGLGNAALGVTAAITDVWAQRMLELGVVSATGDPRLPLSCQGAGVQRAFLIAAHAVCRQRRSKKGNDESMPPGIVAIDEPEVGLHPQAQRALLAGLHPRGATEKECDSCSQSFIATHSPAILHACDPGDVWVLDSVSGELVPKDLETALERFPDKAQRERVRKNGARYWHAIAPALFARAALVVEGATEEGALPVFDRWASEDVDQRYPGFDAADIVLVNAGSISAIAPIARVLSAFERKVIALHDYDIGNADDERHRADIASAADLTLRMPNCDDARDFELMMSLGLEPGVLQAVVDEWLSVYDTRDKPFRDWILEGLPGPARESVRRASTCDGQVLEALVTCYAEGDEALVSGIRRWFAVRCGAGPNPESESQRYFRKTTRYARLWAEACKATGKVPAGIQELFGHIAKFVAGNFTPPAEGRVVELKVRDENTG